MDKVKRALKFILALFIAISIVKPINTYAYSIEYPKVDIYAGTVEQDTGKYGGVYFGPEQYDGETITWGFNLTNKAIYSYGVSFYVDLEPGETISLSYDYYWNGLFPIETANYFLTVVAVGEEFQFDIDLPTAGVNCDVYTILNEAEEGYIQSYCENYTYTNNTAKKIDKIIFTHRFNRSKNVTLALFSINAAYYVKKSADLIEQENNSFLGGIFDNTKNLIDKIIELPQNIANSVEGFFDNIVNAVTNLGNTIIEGLKSLFIPNDDFFSNYFSDLYDFFTEKLGILMLPIDIVLQFFEGIMDIDSTDGIIHIPSVEFMEVVLIQEQEYNLKEPMIQVLGDLYDIYYLVVDMIFITMLLNMAKRKFDVIVGGASS